MNKKIFYISGILLVLLICVVLISSNVSATSKLTASTSDTFYFYDLNSPASQDGYDAAIVIDGKPYYLDAKCYDKLCEESSSFARGFLNQYRDTSSKQEIYNNLNMKMGEIRSPGESSGDFELPIDKTIEFEYKTGKVGMNNEANIITNINVK